MILLHLVTLHWLMRFKGVVGLTFTSHYCPFITRRNCLQAYLRLLNMDYCEALDCPFCSKLDWSQRVVIADGKEQGYPYSLSQKYKPPACDRQVPRTWYVTT